MVGSVIGRSRAAEFLALALAAVAVLACLPRPAHAATETYRWTAPINPPDYGDAPPAGDTVVGAQAGAITDVNVELHDVGHTNPDDLDILLISPSGDDVELVSDVCGGGDVEDIDWAFDDAAATLLPDERIGPCGPGVYQPSSYDNSLSGDLDFFPSGSLPHGTTLAQFNGESALGGWMVRVGDDRGGDVGDIEGGYSITIETAPYHALIPAAGATNAADPYPLTSNVSGETGLITDVNVVLDGLYHSTPDDLDILLVGPQGQSTVLMSDACSGAYFTDHRLLRWDDEAAVSMPDSGDSTTCSVSDYKPSRYGPGEPEDVWPAPAPAGPYGTALSSFDLTDPNGTWRAYLVDDSSDEYGFLEHPMRIELTTRPRSPVTFDLPDLRIAEDGRGIMRLNRAAGPTGLAAGSVTLTSVPGTASADDFTLADTTVEFAPGETTGKVAVTAVKDVLAEADESFTVALGSATGDAAVGPDSSVTVTIDDGPSTPAQPPAAGDSKAPETMIKKGPKRETTKHKAKFTFSADEAGVSFECSLDSKSAFAPCTSPAKFKRLDAGKHKFFVRASDAAGNTDATPAKLKWKVR